MFCTSCGAQIPDESKFCTKCGARLAGSAAANPSVEDADVAQWQPDDSVAGAEGAPEQQPAGAAGPQGAAGSQGAAGMAGLGATGNGAPRMRVPAGKMPNIKAPNIKMPAGGKGTGPFGLPQRVFLGIVGGAAALLIIIIVAVCYALFHTPTINLNKYIEITYDGYNSIGSASYEFDREAMEDDYEKVFDLSAKQIKKAAAANDDIADDVELCGSVTSYAKLIRMEGPANLVISAFNPALSTREELSNGDTVTLTWNPDEDDIAALETLFGCKIQYEDIEDTVKDLEEIATFDPFQGMEISYGGTSPDGYVDEVTPGSDDACKALSYSLDKRDGLANGDTITVTVESSDYYYSDNWQKDFAEEYGKVPGQLSKEVTVEGLPSYATSASEIPDDVLEQMKSQAEDAFNAHVASDWSKDTEQLLAFDYIGNYFLSPKSGTSTRYNNQLYLIYKVKVHDSYSKDDASYSAPFTYYWYCRYTDLYITEDGECSVNLVDYTTAESNAPRIEIDSGVSSGWWSTYTWYYHGYEQLDMMYNQLVTTQIADYTAENNVTDTASSDDSAAEADTTSDDADEDEDDGQVLPDSSSKALTDDDLDDLSDDEIQTAINEIYARHGYTFRDDTIRAQFEEYDWYEPTVAADDFSESAFSQTEKDNIALMREHLN